MAKCGITLRYSVQIVTVQDDGTSQEADIIGEAETLREALAMAENLGLPVRELSDGGASGFVPHGIDGNPHFLVTVYPD